MKQKYQLTKSRGLDFFFLGSVKVFLRPLRLVLETTMVGFNLGGRIRLKQFYDSLISLLRIMSVCLGRGGGQQSYLESQDFSDCSGLLQCVFQKLFCCWSDLGSVPRALALAALS